MAVAVVIAVGLAAPATSASAAPSAGSITVSPATKGAATSALRTAKVTVTATKPASAKRTRWTIPVSGTPGANASSVGLGGRLKFTRGKRSVTFSSLRLTLGKKPTVSGTVGKRRIAMLTLSGAPKRDAATGTIAIKGSRATLHAAAVKLLRKRLSTKRVRSGRLGSAKASIRVPAAPPAKPAPAPPGPQAPAPAPGPGSAPLAPPVVGVPTVPTPPAPEAACWAPTPSEVTDWIGCGAQTGGNLQSWTKYIKGGGTVTPTGDAAVTPSGTGLDHRFSVASAVEHPDGRVTVAHTGGIRYFKHYQGGDLEVLIENMRVVVSADRTSADVVLDATYNSMADPDGPPTMATDVTAMKVNLANPRAKTVPAAGKTTFEMAPATLTAAGRPIWSNYYLEGVAFGAFTITVPDPS